MADDPIVEPTPTPTPEPDPAGTPDPVADPTPTPDPEPKGASIIDDPDGGKVAATPADWPEDWREKMANGDEKALKRLQRMKSPLDLSKSYANLDKKLSSGNLKEPLAEGATDEEIAQYRKDNGIPEAPEGYLESLPDGLVIGDDDKPMVESFLESAHGQNADPAFVASALNWYYSQQEEQVAAQVEADKEFRATAEDEMRAEWGNEYRSNINAIGSFLDTAPTTEDGTPLKELLLGARLSDGTPLGNHPDALRWLSQLATDANPAGFVAPGAGGTQLQSVEDEIATIEKMMREDRAAYDRDTKAQERLRTLYDAQEKLKSQAA